MISLYRGISYIHATRNDPFMWFMCRDMYHHHGACGVAMMDKSSPQLLGSRHAHGWPSNQKKEHKKKHHTRAVKKHEEQTGNVSNIFHIIYVAHLLICLFQPFNHKKHPIYAPMAAPGVDPWRPKSCIVPPIPSTLASSCHEKTFTTCWATKLPGIQRDIAKHQHTQNPWRIHMDPWCWYINANIKGVYWWDPCYHI